MLGYPSKRVGLFIKQSIIFRSDSNGEDLEGYAGAGLYDRYNDQQPWFFIYNWFKHECSRHHAVQD